MTIPAPTSALLPEHSGAWVHPDHKGQGFLVAVKNGRVMCYWFRFDEQGNHVHQHFAAPADNPTGDLWQTRGGGLRDGDSTDVFKAGVASLQPYGDGLLFTYHNELGRSAIELEPLMRGEVSAWVSDVPNQGFVELLTPTFRSLWWFTNRPDGQRWMQIVGRRADADMHVYEVSDGELFGFDDPDAPLIGGAVFQQNHFSMNRAFLAPTIPSQIDHTFQLRRIF